MKVREFPMKNYYYEKVDKDIIDKVAEECFGTPFTLEFKDPYQIKQKEVDELIESWKRYQSQGIITASLKEEITWIDMAEKECIEDYKQKTIDTILMGDYKKEMKMNRVELEMQRLRESTGENYMLNKMVNYNDSNGVYVEYTLYKDYNKYFGLTLEGDTFDVVDIMEEEFAEFLSHYRLSTLYNKRKEENWDISPEENEKIKEAITKSKVSNFKPVYDKNDIGDEIEVGSKIVSEQTLRDIQRSEMKSAQLEADHDNGSDYDIDESTVSGICVNNPSMWFTSNTAEPNGTLTRTESNKVYKGGVDLGDLSDLIHTVVSEVVETLLKEGSCSIDINLNKN